MLDQTKVRELFIAMNMVGEAGVKMKDKLGKMQDGQLKTLMLFYAKIGLICEEEVGALNISEEEQEQGIDYFYNHCIEYPEGKDVRALFAYGLMHIIKRIQHLEKLTDADIAYERLLHECDNAKIRLGMLIDGHEHGIVVPADVANEIHTKYLKSVADDLNRIK